MDKRVKAVLMSLGALAALQAARIGIKELYFAFAERTRGTDRAASAIAMLLLTAAVIIVSKKFALPLSVFPAKFSKWYFMSTLLAAALLVSTPFITKNLSLGGIALLLYGSVLTPVFEELIFRGALWNYLSRVFARPWQVYIVTTLLFGVWHLGYADSIALRVSADALANALLWKAITGACYGAALGAVRLKTGNCYSTILAHGALNIFGR